MIHQIPNHIPNHIPKWIRLPKERQRCKVSDLSRSALWRLLQVHSDEILWYRNSDDENGKGAVLISVDSLREFLEKRAIEQRVWRTIRRKESQDRSEPS